jgi:hypothetical protein
MKTSPSHSSGSVRLFLVFLAIVGALFWIGSQGLYTALTNRRPAVMGYDDYVKTKPTAAWLSLTNCTLDLSDASYRTVSGGTKPLELFVPVHGAGEKTEEVHVLLSTKSPDLMRTFMEIQGLKSEATAMAWMLKNHDRAFPKRDIQGLVRFGIEMKDKERRKLANLQSNLTKDFIILDDSKQPELMKSLGFLIGGVAALGGGIMFMRRNRETAATEI